MSAAAVVVVVEKESIRKRQKKKLGKKNPKQPKSGTDEQTFNDIYKTNDLIIAETFAH